MSARAHGIPLKKQFGQHFLRDQSVITAILEAVTLDEQTNVFEIGCGDGVLTRGILSRPVKKLWVFEIDEHWVAYLKQEIQDDRLTLHHENILDTDFRRFEADQQWTLLSNLPYQVTFPILNRMVENRHLLKEGVVMVQEEVAQKILKTGGRGYGFISLYFQHFFEWKLLRKIDPKSFYPPPKVYSRLLYFKPKQLLVPIPDEDQFWKFIKACFRQPRRTMRNNLAQSHYDTSCVEERTLSLRAQQMSMQDFLELWNCLRQT